MALYRSLHDQIMREAVACSRRKPKAGKGEAMKRPSTIVISDWLANFRQNQWTPFEAGTALKAALAKEGYEIVESDRPARHEEN